MEPAARKGAFDNSLEFRIVSYDAGRILGSSSLEVTIAESGKKTVVVFSGDIGRYDQPILNDPITPPSNADVLLCEPPSGDRDHHARDPATMLPATWNPSSNPGSPPAPPT